MKAYRPWIMMLFACGMLMVSNGMILSGLSAFDKALIAEFGWSRGTLKARDLITLLATGLAAPFMGIVIDRIGVKRLILVGSVALAVAYALYSRIANPLHAYLIHLVFAVVLIGCGLNVAVILVSNWFESKRGTALGIAIAGTSFGGMIFPPVITSLVAQGGWRDAFMTLAAVPLVLLVLAAIIVKSRPSDAGELAFGAKDSGPKVSGVVPELPGMTFAEAKSTSTFWILCFIASMTFYAMMSAMAHLFLHMMDLGFKPPEAAKGLSIMFGLALVGKLVFGFLADVMDQKKVFLGNMAVMLAGALALTTLNKDFIWAAVALFGLGWGGMYTMLQLQAINAFGLKAAGKILGVLVMVEAIGGGVGIFLTGALFDAYKSYQVPFIIISGVLFASLLAGTRVKRMATLS